MRPNTVLVALSFSTALAGCASLNNTLQPSLVCEQWHPISVSKQDTLTDQTAREIAGNNAANVEYCGKRPVEKSPPARVASKQ